MVLWNKAYDKGNKGRDEEIILVMVRNKDWRL
jgi:hypothetical protein